MAPFWSRVCLWVLLRVHGRWSGPVTHYTFVPTLYLSPSISPFLSLSCYFSLFLLKIRLDDFFFFFLLPGHQSGTYSSNPWANTWHRSSGASIRPKQCFIPRLFLVLDTYVQSVLLLVFHFLHKKTFCYSVKLKIVPKEINTSNL